MGRTLKPFAISALNGRSDLGQQPRSVYDEQSHNFLEKLKVAVNSSESRFTIKSRFEPRLGQGAWLGFDDV